VVTVKVLLLVAVTVPLETVTVPVVAPVGTVTVRLVVDAELTVAVVPLNLTVLLAAVLLNPVPVMVTVAPTGPLVVESDEIEYRLKVKEPFALPFLVRLTVPETAVAGTTIVMLDAVGLVAGDTVTVPPPEAWKVATFCDAVVLKLLLPVAVSVMLPPRI
jgi:hypothetical protein